MILLPLPSKEYTSAKAAVAGKTTSKATNANKGIKNFFTLRISILFYDSLPLFLVQLSYKTAALPKQTATALFN
jgi:hypothetical protein